MNQTITKCMVALKSRHSASVFESKLFYVFIRRSTFHFRHLFFTAALLALSVLNVHAQVVIGDNFDDNTLTDPFGLEAQKNCSTCLNGVVTTSFSGTNKVAKLQWKKEFYDANDRATRSTELEADDADQRFAWSQQAWVGFRVYMGSGTDEFSTELTKGVYITQLLGYSGGCVGWDKTFGIEVKGNDIRVFRKWGTSLSTEYQEMIVLENAVKRDQWMTFVYNLKFDRAGSNPSLGTGSGHIKLWLDGMQVINKTNIAIGRGCDSPAPGPYAKWGMYCSGNTENAVRTIYFDDIKISKDVGANYCSVAPGGCSTCLGPEDFTNMEITPKTGTFTFSYDVRPTTNNVGGVVGLSEGRADGYEDIACNVQFDPTGKIKARNGAVYSAANVISYAGGVTYKIQLDVNVSTKKYDAYVTPAGGSKTTIGLGYSFRDGTAPTVLNNLAKQANTCNMLVSNVSFTDNSGPITISSAPINQNSKLELFSPDEESSSLKLYPNPASSFVKLNFIADKEGDIQISVLNALSALARKETHTARKGNNEITLSTEGLPEGVYIIQIQRGEIIERKKLLIGR